MVLEDTLKVNCPSPLSLFVLKSVLLLWAYLLLFIYVRIYLVKFCEEFHCNMYWKFTDSIDQLGRIAIFCILIFLPISMVLFSYIYMYLYICKHTFINTYAYTYSCITSNNIFVCFSYRSVYERLFYSCIYFAKSNFWN